MDRILNVAAYKFAPLRNLKTRRNELRRLSRRLGLKGTVLLSQEGINLFLAGDPNSARTFLEFLKADPLLAHLEVKESFSDSQPFRRMLVKIKKEIIAFGRPVQPEKGHKISPAELKEWLDEGHDFTLLDVRNDYEIRIGTFENALALDINHFRDFPERIETLPATLKKKPVVMFCTGGIRCEKAGPWMQQQGFEEVLQLDGGILKYFEDCGGAYYGGDCFVFDQRVALDSDLGETEATLCFNCLEPLTVEDQRSSKYIPGTSCPFCHRTPEEALQVTIEEREGAIREFSDPLPGSQPYDNLRPMNVPQRCDGMTVVEFLHAFQPHRSAQEWRSLCEAGRIVSHGECVQPDHRVRAGERYSHLIPASVEPSVNPGIRILHEDDWLVVVNKPAPLPVHPSGRFNRNTLTYILDAVYQPEKLRPVHRLDANTTGVLVLCRTREIAAKVQPQFQRGEVEKGYLARVIGHPEEDEFSCDAPVGRETVHLGARLVDSAGLPARTDFRVLKRDSDGSSLLEARPRTGRTNQIRLHLWHLGYPVLGDPVYLPKGRLGSQQTVHPSDPPMYLHAHWIELTHPTRGTQIRFKAEREI